MEPINEAMPELTPFEAASQLGFTRRNFMLAMGAGVATLGASPFLAACSSGGKGSATGPSDSLTVGVFQEPDTLDPNATGLALSSFIASAIYDPLMWWLPKGDGTYEYVPGLAESYEVSADAKTYTYKLRKDVKFHDGTAFNAAAVKATFEHIVDPATKARSALGSLGPYQETKVIDDYTAQVVFKEPNAAFALEMATILFGMNSPAAIQKYGPTGLGNNPVGTGPFKFVSYKTQDQVILVRNDDYKWGPSVYGAAGAAKLKNLTFKILSDNNARYNALRAGQIQVAMNLDPTNINSIKSSKDLTHVNVPSTGQPYGYPLNVDKEPTNELAVRQAILYAVDQDSMIKTVLAGAYERASYLLTPTTQGYNKTAAGQYSYNPEKAKSLLQAAGWVAGSDGVREKNGKKLHLDILIQSANGFDLPTQFVANQLKQVGFSSTITAQPFLTAAASYNQGVQNMSAIFYYDVDPYFLLSLTGCDAIKSGFNWAHWCDPQNDAAIKQANTVADQAKRTKAFEDITAHQQDQAIFLPLWNVSGVYSTVNNLKKVHYGATGYAMFHTAELT